MEEWKRWSEAEKIPFKLVLESFTDNMDGITLEFTSEVDENYKVDIIFENLVLSYRNRDEGDFLKKFKYLSELYGDEFYTKWSMFIVENSEYVNWFNEESYNIHKGEDIKHYVFITINDIVEVLSTNEPKIVIKSNN